MKPYIEYLQAALIAALLLGLIGLGWVAKGWKVDSKLQKQSAEIAQIHAGYDKERLKAQEQLALAVQNNRQAEQHLQAAADEERAKADEQISIASRRADDLLGRVRRAEANAATARLVSATTKTACTGQTPERSNGAELLGSLGSADVLEAQRADKIRIALGSCYAQHDAARAESQ